MKKIKYSIMAVACILLTACMDGEMKSSWKEPDLSSASDDSGNPIKPYGNNSIVENNVITIAQLIQKYPTVFASTDQNTLIEENIQIKGRVTGNDAGGNIYKQFMVQDATGAIIVAVNKNGLSGYLPEGQEILIDLNGLYIGGYRKQPELGAPYNGSSIGRMSPYVWESHVKLLGSLKDINPNVIEPVDFSTIQSNMDNNCAKLVVLKNVTFKDADGKAVFAPKDGSVDLTANCANRELSGMGSNVVIRTNTYADFAAMPLPFKVTAAGDTIPAACNLTGIATRYNSTWQILIRKTSDIQVIQ